MKLSYLLCVLVLLVGCDGIITIENPQESVTVFPDTPVYYHGILTGVAKYWTSNGDGWIEVDSCPYRIIIIGYPVGDYPGVYPTKMDLKTVKYLEDLVGKQVWVKVDAGRVLYVSDVGELE